MGVQRKITQALAQLMSLNMLMWLTMLILLAGILFLAAAAYTAMAAVLVPALAALFTGLGLLVVFLCLAVTLGLRLRAASSPPASEPTTQPGHDGATARASPVDHASEAWAGHSDLIIAAALAAGVALSASPGLRRWAARASRPALARLGERAVRTILK